GGARAVTNLGDVARTGTWPTRDPWGREDIARAGRRRPVTHLGHVARTGGRATGRPRVPGKVLAGRSAAAADVARARVAVLRARGAAAAERVRRAGCPRTGAPLGAVALPRRRPADLGGRGEAVARAVVRDAVARLGDVAGTGRRAADARTLGVRRTGGARTG